MFLPPAIVSFTLDICIILYKICGESIIINNNNNDSDNNNNYNDENRNLLLGWTYYYQGDNQGDYHNNNNNNNSSIYYLPNSLVILAIIRIICFLPMVYNFKKGHNVTSLLPVLWELFNTGFIVFELFNSSLFHDNDNNNNNISIGILIMSGLSVLCQLICIEHLRSTAQEDHHMKMKQIYLGRLGSSMEELQRRSNRLSSTTTTTTNNNNNNLHNSNPNQQQQFNTLNRHRESLYDGHLEDMDFIEKLSSRMKLARDTWITKTELFQDTYLRTREERLDPFQICLHLFTYNQDCILDLHESFDNNPQLIEFYLPQILTFFIYNAYCTTHEIENFILQKSAISIHFAHRCYWFLASFVLNGSMITQDGIHAVENLMSRIVEIGNIPCKELNMGNGPGEREAHLKLLQRREQRMMEKQMLKEEKKNKEETEIEHLYNHHHHHQNKNMNNRVSSSSSSSSSSSKKTITTNKMIPPTAIVNNQNNNKNSNSNSTTTNILSSIHPAKILASLGSNNNNNNNSNNNNKNNNNKSRKNSLLGLSINSSYNNNDHDHENDNNLEQGLINATDNNNNNNNNMNMNMNNDINNDDLERGLQETKYNLNMDDVLLKHDHNNNNNNNTNEGGKTMTEQQQQQQQQQQKVVIPHQRRSSQLRKLSITGPLACVSLSFPLERGRYHGNDCFSLLPKFLNELAEVSYYMGTLVKEKRTPELRKRLETISNLYLPSNIIYIPFCNPFHRIYRIHIEESFCFSTKERVPYLVCFEIIEYASPKKENKKKWWQTPMESLSSSAVVAKMPSLNVELEKKTIKLGKHEFHVTVPIQKKESSISNSSSSLGTTMNNSSTTTTNTNNNVFPKRKFDNSMGTSNNNMNNNNILDNTIGNNYNFNDSSKNTITTNKNDIEEYHGKTFSANSRNHMRKRESAENFFNFTKDNMNMVLTSDNNNNNNNNNNYVDNKDLVKEKQSVLGQWSTSNSTITNEIDDENNDKNRRSISTPGRYQFQANDKDNENNNNLINIDENQIDDDDGDDLAIDMMINKTLTIPESEEKERPDSALSFQEKDAYGTFNNSNNDDDDDDNSSHIDEHSRASHDSTENLLNRRNEDENMKYEHNTSVDSSRQYSFVQSVDSITALNDTTNTTTNNNDDINNNNGDEKRTSSGTMIFKEKWNEKEKRIRKQSDIGNLPGWRLLPVIVKANDDLRQEQFALQLIRQAYTILKDANVPVWMRPYDTFSITHDAGIIEAIADTVSIDALKKNDINYNGLLDFYERLFGDQQSDRFRKARDNFIQSLAAYSILCFIFQVKDRHNGNILIDAKGHIIHIDFGYFLSTSPGAMNFEKAPFKLTAEFVELMGGPRSACFRKFRELCVKTYMELRRQQHKIILLVEMMITGNEQLPCFGEDANLVVEELRHRFHPELNDRAAMEYVHDLIDASLDNWRTNFYDKYQRWCTGIF